MLRLNCLYSKEWQKRFTELMERDLTLAEFYLDLCESKAKGVYFYCGKSINECLKNTEEAIEYNREQIEKHKSMTLLQKMRYKG